MAMTRENINFHKNFMTEDFKEIGVTSKLMESGIVRGDAKLAQKLALNGTGEAIVMPYVDTALTGEGTSGTDDGAAIVSKTLGKGSLTAYATYRNESVGHATILESAKRDGISLSKSVVVALGQWRANMLESKLVHTITGIVEVVKASALDIVKDLETASVLTLNDIVDAKALSTKEMGYIMMNAKTKAQLVKANAGMYVAKSEINKDFELFDGLKIVINKSFALGEAVLIANGAIVSEDVDVNGEALVYAEDKTANGGSGSEDSVLRTCNVMYVEGTSFTGTPTSAFNITNAELANPANWSIIFDEDTTPIVVIKNPA